MRLALSIGDLRLIIERNGIVSSDSVTNIFDRIIDEQKSPTD